MFFGDVELGLRMLALDPGFCFLLLPAMASADDAMRKDFCVQVSAGSALN